uniref:Uncharacterized protein n=1 Tax=Paeonia lactiflora TaxID=35924 RepID=A0AA96SLR0_PAELC|nr:hypothetical protein [Paeonia lactiflora]
MEVDMGITPTRGDLFIKTHTRADNSPSEPTSEIFINEMKKLEALQAGESTMSNSISDLVYYKFFSKECHGHVRGCGPGVKKRDIGTSSSTGQVNGCTVAEIESLNLHIEQMKQRDMERDAEMDAMKHNLLEKDAKLEKMEKQMQTFICLLGDAPTSYMVSKLSFSWF